MPGVLRGRRAADPVLLDDGFGHGDQALFFVTSGLRFDLEALLDSPSAFLRVPMFLLALLVARGVPAALYLRTAGPRKAVAAGLLQGHLAALHLDGGGDRDAPRPDRVVNGSALVGAGLLSVVLFPPVALALLRDDQVDPDRHPERAVAAGTAAPTP